MVAQFSFRFKIRTISLCIDLCDLGKPKEEHWFCDLGKPEEQLIVTGSDLALDNLYMNIQCRLKA